VAGTLAAGGFAPGSLAAGAFVPAGGAPTGCAPTGPARTRLKAIINRNFAHQVNLLIPFPPTFPFGHQEKKLKRRLKKIKKDTPWRSILTFGGWLSVKKYLFLC
jgi:hypothetical protein